MMRIRADRLRALSDSVALSIIRGLVRELDESYPDGAPHDEFVDDVVAFATQHGFEGYRSVRRLAHLMHLDAAKLSGKPLSKALATILIDASRTGEERLDFIDKHLLPRLMLPGEDDRAPIAFD